MKKHWTSVILTDGCAKYEARNLMTAMRELKNTGVSSVYQTDTRAPDIDWTGFEATWGSLQRPGSV